MGTVVDNFTSKIDGKNCYLIPLSLIFIVPVIISVGLFLIPETPRYLIEKGKVEEARKALLWLRPTGYNIEAELLEIQTASAEEKETKKATGWLDLFRDPIDRRRTLLAVAAVSTQAASGAFFMIVSRIQYFPLRTLTLLRLTVPISSRWLKLATPSRMPAFSTVSVWPRSLSAS